MEEHSSVGRGPIAIPLATTQFSVAPGGSITISLPLHNQGPSGESLALSVQGIPSPWVFVPSPVVQLAAGEQREVPITIQAPAYPQGRAGRHRLVIRATSQEAPAVAAEVACVLTVAAVEVPGRIGLLLPATEFPVSPGASISVPLVLLNQGLEGDVFSLAVDGIPMSWVSTTSATTPLAPGQEREVSLTIQPPRTMQSDAGRQPFRIQVLSQAAPGQMAQAECVLTIATFVAFHAELQPRRVQAGEPAQVMVENRGNIQQSFALAYQSPDDALAFEPAPAQEVRVPPGQATMARFRASPRSRHLLGGEKAYPFIARVRASNQETRNLSGEVLSKPLIPGWVLPAILGLIALLIVVVLLGRCISDPGISPPPAATATPGEGQPDPTQPPPEQPTEPPPEQPTEVPPEQPTEAPPEQPTEPPPEQPTDPPEAGQLPAEPEEGGLPCLPAAMGLGLIPLMVVGRKRAA